MNDLVSNEPFFPDHAMLLAQGKAQESWHERAANLSAANFGRRVFVRAVVEVSNFCRENCEYCGMRRDNHSLTRFRARLAGEGFEQLPLSTCLHLPAKQV